MRVVPQRDIDGLQDALDILNHFIVPDPQHTIPGAAQIRIAPLVVRFLLLCVLATIELYDQPALETDEIDEIGTDRPLAAKFECFQATAAQVPPKARFHVGCVPSQIA